MESVKKIMQYININKKEIGVFVVVCTSLAILSTGFVFAKEFKNPTDYDTIQDLITAIIDVVIYIMTPIITLMVIYTGFLFVQAQGNSGKLEQARTALMWTIIGAVIVLGAKGIALAVQSTVTSITG